MEKLYARLNHKNFTLLTIFLCFLGDLSVCRFLWTKILDQKMFNQSFEMVMNVYKTMPEYQGLQIPSTFKDELFQLTSQIMLLFFIAAILFHVVIYFFHYKEKKATQGYLKTTCFFGAIGCFFFGYAGAFKGPIETYMYVQAVFYAYIFLGFGIFNLETKARLKK